MEYRETRRITWRLSWFLLELTVVFSVFSQFNAVEQYARPAMYVAWILTLLMGVIKNQGKVLLSRFTVAFFVAYVLFFGLCVASSFVDSRHLSANYIRVLLVPLMVSFVSDLYASEDRELWNRIGKLYLICSVIFAIWVQQTYFSSYAFWLKTKVYLFAQKNSAAQIWVSAVLISVLLLDYRNKFEKILIYIACAYLLFMTGISQCRTAILGVVVALVSFSVSRVEKKGKWILLIAISMIVAWKIPGSHRYIEQALFLNKYEGADLNTFSAGRIDYYKMALQKIGSSPYFGVGKYYVDCSYLSILAESGILGFVLIEWIWIKKVLQCFRFQGDNRNRAFLFVITVFYLVESVLEGFPPFGPGVSSFMFWLISGILLNQSTKDKLMDATG